MCGFVSWIEKDGNIYYLTYRDIYHTKRGKELRDYCKNESDYIGHGAIRHFYDNFEGGKDLECTDFSTPKNFPSEIVSAIKKGEFRGLGVARELLNAKAQKAYYAAMREPQKAYDAAMGEPQKAYYAAMGEAQKAYYAAMREPQKAYDAAMGEAQKAYDAAMGEPQKAYDAARSKFWDLFKIKKNRNPLWR